MIRLIRWLITEWRLSRAERNEWMDWPHLVMGVCIAALLVMGA